ncbi:MAG: 2-oxoacid:acceptor oxidoreductase subunit alpha [Candidatus Paceibacterota bacterium]|jgi:2-oxoglutarate ferredoxin oxidoreductase subunit alpha|nr:2-oxoacid:acceptor oxidoreductase subunit alpha [Candidatus Paceibacterota bacterium]
MENQKNSQIIRTIGIGGAAGDGIREAGLHLAEIFNKLGYHSFLSFDYPSVIRGGHNFSRLSVSSEKISGDHSEIDVLIAVNAESVRLHLDELKEDAVVFVEQAYFDEVKDMGKHIIALPMADFTKEQSARPVARTTVGLGALSFVAGLTPEKNHELVSAAFQDYGGDLNGALADKGFKHVEGQNLPKWEEGTREVPRDERMEIIDSNRAIAKGFLAAGLQFYIAYPMTPSTSILHFLAKEALNPERKLKTIQPEDEISAINMAIGVAYSGKKVATGTATGGFALMQEAFSFAGVSESPLVVVVSQRQGPATGVPTNTSQGDLQFVLHSGHGEFPRIVIAPGDAEEAYLAAGNALNLAWKYQIPAIILVDKQISESSQTAILDAAKIVSGSAKPWTHEGKYERYQLAEDGISPLASPGTENAVVKLTSYEHDEFGIATDDPEMVKKMMDKRFKKSETLALELSQYDMIKVSGDLSSDTALLFWGSSKGAVLEAAKQLKKPVKLVQILWMEPFDSAHASEALAGMSKIISIEGNHNGQLSALLREKTGIDTHHKILRYDSKPFDPSELASKINALL